ncbi:hypothetical protein AUP74_00093 [Microbulbifer aggregans]|uniref:Uncharacterized protein n=1 Tax=Microbulbifer aggregans TaxID=1769779 RepID=A0A1C9W344_9GAMM|nr:hypothetical protein [Microbulbifer aggregans]AOS95570.1 hypothetical protein AUP74_00093 [Microbulbifer aggregans]
MRRRKTKPQSQRRRPYRASPLCRHRIRVRWLLAQRIRMRNYMRSFSPEERDSENDGDN